RRPRARLEREGRRSRTRERDRARQRPRSPPARGACGPGRARGRRDRAAVGPHGPGARHPMTNVIQKASLVLAVFVVTAAPASARRDEGATTGIHGRGTDPPGGGNRHPRGRVAGPSGRRAVRTDAEGQYRVSDLAPGAYEVAVAKDGFAPYQGKAVTVAAGRDVAVDVRLDLAPVEETVNVEERPPALSLQPDE